MTDFPRRCQVLMLRKIMLGHVVEETTRKRQRVIALLTERFQALDDQLAAELVGLSADERERFANAELPSPIPGKTSAQEWALRQLIEVLEQAEMEEQQRKKPTTI